MTRLRDDLKKIPAPVGAKKTGLLGYLLRSVYTIQVPGMPSKVFIRFPDGGFVRAFHDGNVRFVGTFEESVSLQIEHQTDGWHVLGIPSSEQDAHYDMFGPSVTVPEYDIDTSELADFGTLTLTPGYILVVGMDGKITTAPFPDTSAGWFAQEFVVSIARVIPADHQVVIHGALTVDDDGSISCDGQLWVID